MKKMKKLECAWCFEVIRPSSTIKIEGDKFFCHSGCFGSWSNWNNQFNKQQQKEEVKTTDIQDVTCTACFVPIRNTYASGTELAGEVFCSSSCVDLWLNHLEPSAVDSMTQDEIIDELYH